MSDTAKNKTKKNCIKKNSIYMYAKKNYKEMAKNYMAIQFSLTSRTKQVVSIRSSFRYLLTSCMLYTCRRQLKSADKYSSGPAICSSSYSRRMYSTLIQQHKKRDKKVDEKWIEVNVRKTRWK